MTVSIHDSRCPGNALRAQESRVTEPKTLKQLCFNKIEKLQIEGCLKPAILQSIFSTVFRLDDLLLEDSYISQKFFISLPPDFLLQQSNLGRLSLHRLMRRNKIAIVTHFLDGIAKLQKDHTLKSTVDISLELLKKTDATGDSLLHIAIDQNEDTIRDLLLEIFSSKSGFIERGDMFDVSPLEKAVEAKNKKAITAIISAGSKFPYFGKTVPTTTLQNMLEIDGLEDQFCKLIQTLRDDPYKVLSKDNLPGGKTLLHKAIEKRRTEAAKALILTFQTSKEFLKTADVHLESPLVLAKRQGLQPIVELLELILA